MASIRHNRVFLTVAMVLAIAGGGLIALESQGLTERSVGIGLIALGLAMPFWISLGQNKDQRRRLNALAQQLGSVRRETDQPESIKDLQSELSDLTLRVGSLSQRLRVVEASTGNASTGNAQQEILIRLRQLSMSLVELARHHDAAREEFATLERRLDENFNMGDIPIR